MIEITSGNIFNAGVECITDANNSIGISGAGLARLFANKYPKVAENYNTFSVEWQKAKGHVVDFTFDSPELMPPVIFPKGYLDNSDYAICKFPTMIFPGERTKSENIKKNLESLVGLLQLKKINSIALPALGCGIGGFQFSILQKLVEESFKGTNYKVVLYQPI